MDNPISWGILVILAILVAYWFFRKVDEEMEARRRENDDIFWGE